MLVKAFQAMTTSPMVQALVSMLLVASTTHMAISQAKMSQALVTRRRARMRVKLCQVTTIWPVAPVQVV